MQVNGQTPTTSSPGKQPLVHTGYEAGYASLDAVNKNQFARWEAKHNSLVIQPLA